MLKKSSAVMSKPASAARPKVVSSGPSQRQMAMAALQPNIASDPNESKAAERESQ